MSTKASFDLLDALHNAVAHQLLDKIQTGEATAAEISVAVKFLKDGLVLGIGLIAIARDVDVVCFDGFGPSVEDILLRTAGALFEDVSRFVRNDAGGAIAFQGDHVEIGLSAVRRGTAERFVKCQSGLLVFGHDLQGATVSDRNSLGIGQGRFELEVRRIFDRDFEFTLTKADPPLFAGLLVVGHLHFDRPGNDARFLEIARPHVLHDGSKDAVEHLALRRFGFGLPVRQGCAKSGQ